MERKIGEIFEYNAEWYQCVEQPEKYDKTVCAICAFQGNGNCELDRCSGTYRSDKKSVIFKKLEKVGEPYTTFVDKTVQNYLLETAVTVPPKDVFTLINNEQRLIAIEIKQTKEDMEEKGQCCDNRFEIIAKAKEALLKETNIARDEQEMAVIDNILFRCWQMGWLDKYDDTKHSNSESIGKNLKPFSLEAAKAGKPVCTRGVRKARIICFDVKGSMYPIISLIEESEGEKLCSYMPNGRSYKNEKECIDDLMMLPEKKEGWVNIYNRYSAELTSDGYFYFTKEEALSNIENYGTYVKTIKMSWEE